MGAEYNMDQNLWNNLAEVYRQLPNGGPQLRITEGHIDNGTEILARFSTDNEAAMVLEKAGFKEWGKGSGIYKIEPKKKGL
jgi:hypothetical protein